MDKEVNRWNEASIPPTTDREVFVIVECQLDKNKTRSVYNIASYLPSTKIWRLMYPVKQSFWKITKWMETS